MTENVIVDKTYSFAVGITRYCFDLQDNRREYVLSHQLLKCGTSIQRLQRTDCDPNCNT